MTCFNRIASFSTALHFRVTTVTESIANHKLIQLCVWCRNQESLYNDVIMGVMTSQITSLTIVYSSVYSDADQRKHQSSASLAFVRGIHRGPVNSPHKWPVTRIMFPFDEVIMKRSYFSKTSPNQYCFTALIQYTMIRDTDIRNVWRCMFKPCLFEWPFRRLPSNITVLICNGDHLHKLISINLIGALEPWGYSGFTLSVRLSIRSSVCRRHGFQNINKVCFGISISKFICMFL